MSRIGDHDPEMTHLQAESARDDASSRSANGRDAAEALNPVNVLKGLLGGIANKGGGKGGGGGGKGG